MEIEARTILLANVVSAQRRDLIEVAAPFLRDTERIGDVVVA